MGCHSWFWQFLGRWIIHCGALFLSLFFILLIIQLLLFSFSNVYSLYLRCSVCKATSPRAIGMLQTGSSQREVASTFTVSHSVISRLWNRYQQTQNAITSNEPRPFFHWPWPEAARGVEQTPRKGNWESDEQYECLTNGGSITYFWLKKKEKRRKCFKKTPSTLKFYFCPQSSFKIFGGHKTYCNTELPVVMFPN